MGPDLTEKYLEEDFAKYDADGDGEMNYEEFKVGILFSKTDLIAVKTKRISFSQGGSHARRPQDFRFHFLTPSPS